MTQSKSLDPVCKNIDPVIEKHRSSETKKTFSWSRRYHVHAKDAGQEAGDSKWEIARCCYMKGFYIFFDMAASSYSPLRISSF